MRPLSLRIEGLRSFRSEVEIDFGDRDHIAVIGDTGAGKSSILEAMTYALYGKTSIAGQTNRELMNDTSHKLRVVLRFRVSHQEWEVARTLRRSRDGKGEAQLQCLGRDGKTLEQVEQVRLVNDRIEQLIGLDRDAFLRTVVLPQGRFARLLVEDKPAARSEVLRKVWPTNDLEAVGELASHALKGVQDAHVRLQQEADAHPEDPEARLAELTANAKAAERQAKEASALAERASQAMSAMSNAVERKRSAAAKRDRLEEGLAQIDKAEARVDPIAKVKRAIDGEESELKQKLAGIRDRLKSLPSDDDGPGRNKVAEALAKLKDFGEVADAAVAAAEKMRARETEAASRREAAAQAQEAVARAKDEKERHAQLRPPLAEAAETAGKRRAKAQSAHEQSRKLHGDALDAQAKAASLGDRRTKLAAEAEAADRDRAKATEARKAADDRLAHARRASSAAAAAHGLDPGDDCPVCRRDLPEGWAPPSDEGLTEAQEAAQATSAAAEASAQRANEVRAQLHAVEEQLGGARTDAERAVEARRAAVADLVVQFGDDTVAAAADAQAAVLAEAPGLADAGDGTPPLLPPLPPLESLVGPLDECVRRASNALSRHDEEHGVLDKKLTEQSNAAVKAEVEAGSTQKLADAAGSTAHIALEQLKRNVGETPAPYRPPVALPSRPAELDEIDSFAAVGPIEDAQERQRVLDHRDRQRKELVQAREQANTERDALDRHRVTKVEQPLAAVRQPLDRHRDAVLSARDALELDDDRKPADQTPADQTPADLPLPSDPKDPAALQQWMQELRSATSAVVDAANAQIEQAAAAAKVATEVLSDVGRRLDADQEPADPEAVVSAANAARDDANYHARTAASDRAHFAAAFDDVLALRALLHEAEELERALTDLDKALKPGAFLKWLTLRRSRSLLVHASRMLGEISGGKYSFADPVDDEVQWSVLDRESGQPRSPASLSGGEQFIASLALALGLVEMMARSGGRLESLFLDEGFGSLDRNNLDAAVEALGTVAAKGRMVGVISHVRAVAEQVDHVLAVTRTAAGSRVKWLSQAQKSRWSLSDAGSEASEAMRGLLE